MCCTTLVCKNDATNNPQSFHYRSSLSRPTKETEIMTCLSIFSSHFSLCFFTMYVLSTILCAHLFVKLLYVYNNYVCRKMCRCKNHLIFMLYLQAGRLGNETRMYWCCSDRGTDLCEEDSVIISKNSVHYVTHHARHVSGRDIIGLFIASIHKSSRHAVCSYDGIIGLVVVNNTCTRGSRSV